MTLVVLGVTFVVLMAFGRLIAVVIGSACLGALFVSGQSLTLLRHLMHIGIGSFVLVADPMLVLAGVTMSKGRMTTALSDILVGRLRGEIGHTGTDVSGLFAGITGSTSADTTELGSVLIPSMAERGYDRP